MAFSVWNFTAKFGQMLPRFFRQCSLYKFSTKAVSSADLPEVQYPPIKPSGDELKYIEEMEERKNAPTVLDMIYLLKKKQCWHYQLKPACLHPNFLPVYKHATKTHVVEGLPEYVKDFVTSDKIKQIAASVKYSVENFALQEMVYGHRHKIELRNLRYDKAKCFVENMVNHFLLTEIGQIPHILNGAVDHDVDVKSFWEREDTRYQYTGHPIFLLRTEEPLCEFTSRDSDLSVGEVEPYPYKPQWYSIFKWHHNSMCFPGYKYGSPINYGHTQLFVGNYLKQNLLAKGQAFYDEVLLGHGMITSFGWLAAKTMYHKHYWDDDLTRPMTCNTILTDGKNFSFYCYQLNTIALHSRVSETNNLRNVCWYTKDAPLYTELTEDGEVVGFNLDVLKTIIGMLMMPPGTNMLRRDHKEEEKLDQQG